MFSTKLVQNIVLIVLAVVLVLAATWAYLSGTHAGQSKVILQNTKALQTGLGYFYGDQDRYPSTLEFSDRNLMLTYFNPFPPAQINAGACPQSYKYVNPSQTSYELDFCLPKGAQGFGKGWNAIRSRD